MDPMMGVNEGKSILYFDDYQTNPDANDGIPIVLQRINGTLVGSDAWFTAYDDIYACVNSRQDKNVMHLSILADVASTIIRILENFDPSGI